MIASSQLDHLEGLHFARTRELQKDCFFTSCEGTSMKTASVYLVGFPTCEAEGRNHPRSPNVTAGTGMLLAC